MESRPIFQAETQAKNLSVELGPSVKRGYTNLTEYRVNANVTVDNSDNDGSGTPLGGDPILDEFEISEARIERGDADPSLDGLGGNSIEQVLA